MKIPTPPDSPENEAARSKSSRKREMADLRKLGEALVNLPLSRLARIPLTDDLIVTLAEHRRLKQGEARRRHLRYIARLLRQEDLEAVAAAMAHLETEDRLFRRQAREAEVWRDTLIEEGDAALANLITQQPNLDHQHLRQLIRGARQDSTGRAGDYSRKLFAYLRDNLGR